MSRISPHRAKRGIAGISITILSSVVFLQVYQSCVLAQNGSRIANRRPQSFPGNRSPQEKRPTEVRIPNNPLVDKIVDVRVEGNKTIPLSAIAAKIKTRPGPMPSTRQIQQDVKSLYRTRWFFSVEPRFRKKEKGMVLVFMVIERPIVRSVEYHGNKKIKDKHLKAITGLKKGSPFDVSSNKESARRLEDHYHEKGFVYAKVKLVKGNRKEDRDVVFEIEEGSKVRVGSIKFEGNKFVSDGVLKTKIRSKSAILWTLGGMFDPAAIEDDVAAVKQYYTSLGFFDVKVISKRAFNNSKSRIYLKFEVEEGSRYKVRQVELLGNRVLTTEQIYKDLNLKEGDFFNSRFLLKDVEMLKSKYGEKGRLFATIDAVPRFLEQEGVADLIYRIDEDRVYEIRRIIVNIKGDNPRTKRTVILNRATFAPGDRANSKMFQLTKRRLEGSQLFVRGPQGGPEIILHRILPELGEDAQPDSLRGQSHDELYRHESHWIERVNAAQEESSTSKLQPQKTNRKQKKVRPIFRGTNYYKFPKSNPFKISNRQRPRKLKRKQNVRSGHQANRRLEKADTDNSLSFFQNRQKPWVVDHPANRRASRVVRGQNFDNGIRRPGNPLYNNNVQGDPLGGQGGEPPTGYIDPEIIVTEDRTGRFIFGAGLNSDAGIVGNVVISETNFDLFRPPRSFEDVLDGTAWRGAGQRFRLEAVPGNIVSRYLFSWTEPYLLDTNYSLSVSGFFYKRFFTDWDEQRTGTRVSVGKQLTPKFSISGSFRLEEVRLDDPDVPTPAILAKALGSSLLTNFGVNLTHDTRDAAFLPAEGHLIQLGFEQGVGDWIYPRLTAEASQFFTLYKRADGGGRQILTLKGQLGWTDSGTPIFERFFAGGFQTFRGFGFRGVSPRQLDVRVGGNWLALGTVEYMAPLLANEMVHGVLFTDFGTVENDPGFNDFRVNIGAGLRVMVPAMGPVPLAFDFAVPLIKVEGDDRRLFSFFMGFTR